MFTAAIQTEAFRKVLGDRAAFEMQSPLTAALGTPFSAFSLPSTAMIVYAVIYLLVELVVAINTFQHRDI